MINPKELRLGNLLRNAFGEVFEANIYTLQYPNTEFGSVEPILLTEEWLVKFGFEHSKTTDKYYTKGNNYAVSCADNKFRFIQGNFVCQLVLTEIKYVHQLQNLCLDLNIEIQTLINKK